MTLTEPVVINNLTDGWNVEQFDEGGGCLVTNFTGPNAEKRAREYAAWLVSESWRPADTADLNGVPRAEE